MHYDYLFSDDMVGIKKEDEETNLNSQTNANENMFDNEEFNKKLNEATDKVRAEFKEEVDALKSKLLEYESKLSTEEKEDVDNENE